MANNACMFSQATSSRQPLQSKANSVWCYTCAQRLEALPKDTCALGTSLQLMKDHRQAGQLLSQPVVKTVALLRLMDIHDFHALNATVICCWFGLARGLQYGTARLGGPLNNAVCISRRMWASHWCCRHQFYSLSSCKASCRAIMLLPPAHFLVQAAYKTACR